MSVCGIAEIVVGWLVTRVREQPVTLWSGLTLVAFVLPLVVLTLAIPIVYSVGMVAWSPRPAGMVTFRGTIPLVRYLTWSVRIPLPAPAVPRVTYIQMVVVNCGLVL